MGCELSAYPAIVFVPSSPRRCNRYATPQVKSIYREQCRQLRQLLKAGFANTPISGFGCIAAGGSSFGESSWAMSHIEISRRAILRHMRSGTYASHRKDGETTRTADLDVISCFSCLAIAATHRIWKPFRSYINDLLPMTHRIGKILKRCIYGCIFLCETEANDRCHSVFFVK